MKQTSSVSSPRSEDLRRHCRTPCKGPEGMGRARPSVPANATNRWDTAPHALAHLKDSSRHWERGGLQPSQLPRIGKRKRRHPPGVLVEDQGTGDRRLGALAAILALAKPAIDADRRALGFFEIHPRGVDELCGVTDF